MADFLKIHALENVWCEPAQDRHWIVKAIRLTPTGGTFLSVTVGWEQIALPTIVGQNRVTFHVYQIGQIAPSLINILDKIDKWIPAGEVCETNNVMFHAYFENGVTVPLGASYFMLTRDKNVLLAVRSTLGFGGTPLTTPMDNPAFTLNIRFYSNAYFDSPRWTSIVNRPGKGIRVLSKRVLSVSDYNQFKAEAILIQNEYGSLGKGTYWVDGFVATSNSGWKEEYKGKWFELVWDASIRKQLFFTIDDLQAYTSSLDAGEAKLLILSDTTYDTIDYQDDVDVYLIKETSPDYKGVYYIRDNDDSLRQVTHNAYGIMGNYLTNLSNEHTFLQNLPEDKLMLNIREAGFKRGLVHQNNRIEELYRMDYAAIYGSIVGVNATVDVWKAENLEASAYNEIMRSIVGDIDDEMLENAYGYNALTELSSYPYQIPRTSPGGNKLVDMPPAMMIPHPVSGLAERCMFCYDTNGKLVKFFNNSGNYETVAIPQPTVGIRIAEVLNNRFDSLTNHAAGTDGTYFPNMQYNSGNNTYSFTNTTVSMKDLEFNGFRCYVCPMAAGVISEDWEDVTENVDNYYTYNTSGPVPVLTWNAAALAVAHLYPCVKINRRVLFYKVPLNPDSYPGIIDFTVNAKMTFNGVTQTRPQKLPFGTVDVFMDGVPLMENFDYKVIWPQIVIYRKPTRTPPEGLEVYVRCYGFCNPDTMQHYGPRDSGFVKDGLVSVDGTIDIRNDRNIRITVGDQLKLETDVRFAEDTTGPLLQDGLPFTITDVIAPVEHFTAKDTVAYRKESLDIDEAVQDYLNVHITEPPETQPVIINNQWFLFSPFASVLIHALKEGFLGSGELDSDYDSNDVNTWVGQYLYLLDFDPIATGQYDTPYIQVHPHQYPTTMELTSKQYEFISFINQYYLANKLNLSHFITISGS